MPQPRFSKLAELLLETAANELGAIYNRVSDDQNGWDALVEFEPSNDPDIPADLRPAQQRVLIQVKHSLVEERATSVKLSNALKYSTEEMPWFIVFIKYEQSSTTPRAVYVKHVWTNFMATSLREVRKADVKGRKLSSIRTPITFERGELCDGNPVDWMLKVLSQVGPQYGKQKSDLARSLGYDSNQPAAFGTFTLDEGVSFSSFVDLNLGLIESLPISGFTFTDNRFGIPAKERNFGSGRISVDVDPARDCVVTVRNHASASDEVSWPGRVYVPGLPNLRKEHRRVRIVAGPIQIILSEGKGKISINFPFEDGLSVSEQLRQLTLRSWCDSHDLELAVWSEGKCLVLSDVTIDDPSENAGRYWKRLREAFVALVSTVPEERLPNSLTVSTKTLTEERHDLIEFVNGHLDAPAEFEMRLEAPPLLDITQASVVVTPSLYELSGHVFVSIVQRKVTHVAVDGCKITLQTEKARIVRSAVLEGEAETHRDFITEEVKWAEKRADRSHGCVLSYRPADDEVAADAPDTEGLHLRLT